MFKYFPWKIVKEISWKDLDIDTYLIIGFEQFKCVKNPLLFLLSNSIIKLSLFLSPFKATPATYMLFPLFNANIFNIAKSYFVYDCD